MYSRTFHAEQINEEHGRRCGRCPWAHALALRPRVVSKSAHAGVDEPGACWCGEARCWSTSTLYSRGYSDACPYTSVPPPSRALVVRSESPSPCSCAQADGVVSSSCAGRRMTPAVSVRWLAVYVNAIWRGAAAACASTRSYVSVAEDVAYA